MEKENPSPDHYIPGTCNIGTEEVKKRKRTFLSSLIVVLTCLLLYLKFSDSFFMCAVLFVSLSVSTVMYFQWRRKFCVRFGLMGYFNFGKLYKTEKVTDKESKVKDQLQALKIIMFSVLTAIFFIVIIIFFINTFE